MDDKDDVNRINEILSHMHQVISNGTMDDFKDLIQNVHKVKNRQLKCTTYNNWHTEMVSLICKYNKKKHLKYLLYESHFLDYLTIENTAVKHKEDSFYYAMRSNDFETLEILYDFWSGDLHCLGHKKEYDQFDIENIIQLGLSLNCAFNRYKEDIQIKRKINIQNILNIESLIAFNAFQIELYSELNSLKTNLITWEDEPEDVIRIQETHAIKTIILAVFKIHEKHTTRDLLKDSFLGIVKELDTSSLIHETDLFTMYEEFFRKLDYNFCLLILDNLHLLKLRLSMPKLSYQRIENKLYYFIYQISNKWRLYLPKKRKFKTINVLSLFKGELCCISHNEYDYWKQNVYNVIYLERRDFERVINCFKNELENRSVEENLRKSQTKLPNEDNNCLMLLPHLRDNYSLKRISEHIAQLHSINFKCEKKYTFLLIERTLQVVGEFLKSTEESLHLQEPTEALVKAEISVDVVNDLKALRNLLCHAKNGEFLKRIEVEVNNEDIFDLILEELLYVKKKIDEVIRLYKPIVERDLTRNAMCILRNRKSEMPDKVEHIHYYIVDTLTQFPVDFLRNTVAKDYYQNTWAPLGFSDSLLEEVSMLATHSRKLNLKLNKAIKDIHNNVILKFPFYKERIKNSLKIILDNIERWRRIVEILKAKNSVELLHYPNEEDANRLKSYSNKFLGDDFVLRPAEFNDLFVNVQHHWKFIENLLWFIIETTGVFNDTIEELKFDLYTSKLKGLRKYNYKSTEVEQNVIEYVELVEEKLNTMKVRKKCRVPRPKSTEKIFEFRGIKKFTNKLMTTNMLTREEKIFLINIIEKTDSNNNAKKISAIELMINKIETDTPIPKKEYTRLTESLKLERKPMNILMNLVMGHKRNPLLPQCLSKRIFLLEDITKQQSAAELVLRYKSDKIFRVLLEVLLFDIFIVLECNKSNPYLKKSSKLLTEINLRNILIHGSPLLETVGNVLDANDLPTELVTKALDFIADKKSIDSLCALTELDFDFTQINITQKQTALLDEFKKSPRWKDYLNLLPEHKRNMYEKHKKKVKIDDTFIELIKAVNTKDSVLVQNCIDNGANVNFLDHHKRAVIHYAAMKGSVDVLGVLLKNEADINIVNTENNLTALHYSAMNNFIDAVKFLLMNGANCHALDNKGRTPVYWAGQRNHSEVCRVLIQAMKKNSEFSITDLK